MAERERGTRGKMTKLELLDIDIEWSLGNPTRTSFTLRITTDEGNKHIMIADNLIGDVIVKEELEQK